MAEAEVEYSSRIAAGEWRLTLLSFNLNRQTAPKETEKMRVFFTDEETERSDMIVIGLQEVSHTELLGAEPWSARFKKYLCAHGFIKLSLSWASQLWLGSNEMLVFAKSHVMPSILKMESRFVRNMFWGIAGHKGAIGAKITFKDGSYLLLITCHLAPNFEALNRRIKEFHWTQDGMKFLESQESGTGYTFWLGDMNFRAENLAADEFDAILKTSTPEQIHDLVENHDQLRIAHNSGKAFSEYEEATITFKPTYRVLIGSNGYDLKRVPSWCDRILYRVIDEAEALNVRALSYTSIPAVVFSDHVPVKGSFAISAPKNVSEASSWAVKFDVSTDSAWLQYQPIMLRFQIDPSYWKVNGSNKDWVAIYKADMKDTGNTKTWKYVMSCWDEQIGHETWTCGLLTGIKHGKYRFGYYSNYLDCLIGLSDPFEIVRRRLSKVRSHGTHRWEPAVIPVAKEVNEFD
uniref:Inositol polyphosphate-related phosphatase domain-containing protein n=1 Tax=Plectus sambesii TaxID=2011161 RepID=A0A914X8R2_9BILA